MGNFKLAVGAHGRIRAYHPRADAQLARPSGRKSMWVGLLCCSVLTPHNPPVLRARVTPAASLVTMRSAQEWRSNIPNYLTFARVGAVPVLIATFYIEKSAAARVPALLFGFIALTDWVDGYLARRWKVESELGAFLDPVADKFLVCTALVLLSGALPLNSALALASAA